MKVRLGGGRARRLLRAGSSLTVFALAVLFASTARGGGVGLLTTAKTIPPATVAVIDPESGTSAGGGTTDVRVGVGDIILFRFRYMPVPESQLVGINGWLTEYIPPNLQVVGVRLMDENDLTIPPALPGLAENGYGFRDNDFTGVPCSGATCPVGDGGVAQVYHDTGIFYSTDVDTERLPSGALITLDNGRVYADPVRLGGDANLRDALGVASPFRAHNDWDWNQASLLGQFSGNTPHLYGSPVAGPQTHYRYEVTDNGGSLEFRSQTGPWNRIVYPGSQIATGGPAASSNGDGMDRYIADASAMGLDVTPNNPVPATANALRIATGQLYAGRPIYVEIAFRVLGTPLDPGFGASGGDVNCGESFGGDIAGHLTSHDADHNMWGFFVPSPACVFLNLLFDVTADEVVRNNSETYNDITYTLRTRNLSTLPRNNTWVRLKYDPNRLGLSNDAGRPPFPDVAPTCQISNCDGDGDACIFWDLGTLDPSEDVSIRTNIEVTNLGNPTTPVRADFTSDDLGTRSGNPCGGGAITSPGFRTQELVQMRSLGVLDATLSPSSASVASPGFGTLTGSIAVEGTQNLTVRDIWVPLPPGWRVRNTGGPSTPDITVNGVREECSSDCATDTPKFDGVNITITEGTSVPLSFAVNVPSGVTADNYPIDLEMWSSQSGYGGTKEYYFDDIAHVSVGRVRSAPPVLDCPILSSWTTIPGSTTEADGTVVRVYFNGIQRGEDPATSGRFDVADSPDGVTPWAGSSGVFGDLYGGLEVRATAQAPGENESVLSTACFVTQVSQCQDGLDNDGDGLIDFPADPGCSSPSDGDETDPECSDGIDNDGDGDIDWPADLECTGPDDDAEGGAPACGDGIDNDGDGDVDFPADADCTSATDRSETTLRRCMNRIDDDGDGLVDFPSDPGCHSPNDDDELDFAYLPDDIRARLLIVFDTSGSMNWNTCTEDFTGGDGSAACAGDDVACALCSSATCGNGFADDSRIYQARQGIRDVVAGFGEVEYSLMRFHQRPRDFDCPTSNASAGSGGWQGAGAAPCGGGFSGGDLLVGFSPENEYDLLEWMDGSTNHAGATPEAGLDFELRGSGTTPIAGSLDDARAYLDGVRAGDGASMCRPYRVILITDGQETCGGDPVAAAGALDGAGYPVSVIGFATGDPTVRANLDAIAAAGGTTGAIFADDSVALSAAISDIVNDSILTEVCNGVDDDCDTLIDEGYTRYCDVPGGVMSPTLCTDPGETVCNGVDDNCDGRIDEGLRNACGTCGTPPAEICNGLDDDCDGPIDEGGVCSTCIVEPEICDGADNDCDVAVDEGLMRTCGTDVGACTSGTETCTTGVWGACSGTGPITEACNGIDDDCDGVIDSITRPCGPSTGACEPGTELCTGGSWSGSCVGAVGPTAELCNTVDDDCDGATDEDTGGGACGSSIGRCTPGTLTCSSGALVCTGGTGPIAETCNGVDDDCDGPIDEDVTLGATCGSAVGVCVTGSTVCTGGAVACGCPSGYDAVTDPARGPFCVPTGASLAELCNGLDDDCDGAVDEGNPEGGGTCGSTDVGECDFGREVCSGGTLVCVGETTPGTEVCDDLDNDCDSLTDESLTRPCGIDRGICTSGTETCTAGVWGMATCVPPEPEACNALDDDCDGRTDEGLDLGLPCGEGRGECVPGTTICSSGMTGVCSCPPGYALRTRVDGTMTVEICAPDDGGTGPVVEVCNALDDDCDGAVDEELPLGGPCGDTEGACMPGSLQCISGREVCVGEVPAGPEVCDCEDNDCDGTIDEDPSSGSLCPGESICLDCSCALPCADSEFGRCPAGRIPVESDEGCYCVAPRCNPDTCATETVEAGGEVRCAPDDPTLPECTCRMNECTFPCDGVTCMAPTVCNPQTGRCVPDDCRGLGCPPGEICDVVALECVEDPCETAGCAADEVCRRGTCEPSCATVTCATGEVCRSGVCETDLCAGVACGTGEVCNRADGACVPNLCGGISCPEGTSCDPVTGACRNDPCTFVRCPEGQFCFRGECQLEERPEEDGGVPIDGGTVTPGDGGGFDGGRPDDEEDRVLVTGACVCEVGGPRGGGSSGPLIALFGLIAAIVWRRRRR